MCKSKSILGRLIFLHGAKKRNLHVEIFYLAQHPYSIVILVTHLLLVHNSQPQICLGLFDSKIDIRNRGPGNTVCLRKKFNSMEEYSIVVTSSHREIAS